MLDSGCPSGGRFKPASKKDLKRLQQNYLKADDIRRRAELAESIERQAIKGDIDEDMNLIL